jgi:hypothetical protein
VSRRGSFGNRGTDGGGIGRSHGDAARGAGVRRRRPGQNIGGKEGEVERI